MNASAEETPPLSGVEIAEIHDLKRWTTYFTPGEEVRGIWWSTRRKLPSGTRFELLVKDDEGNEVWRGTVQVAIDSAFESDDPGVPLVPESEWSALSQRLPELTFVATEQLRVPPGLRRKG